MRRALLLVLAALPFASAQEKKDDKKFVWDPRQRTRVVVGNRTFYDYEVGSRTNMVLTTKGDSALVTSRSEAAGSFRWVRHVVGVESGEISEANVSVERWRLNRKGVLDASLEGKTVALRRKGSKLQATIEDGDGVTAQGREWLDGELFRGSGRLASTEYVEDLLLIREPAAVTTGCEWTRDPRALALGMLGTTDVDVARSSVTGRLTDVRLERGVHYGRASVDAALQMRKLDMSEMRFEDGALVEIEWRYEGSLERTRRDDGAWSLTVRTMGHSRMGESLDAEMRNERTETLKCGPVRK